jgi:large subunit ribosomal protein L23
MNVYEVLLRPMITEKSTVLAEAGKYIFQVASGANKQLVKEAVQKTFGVKVVDVNTAVIHGKRKRFGVRVKKMPDVKKAVVTLRAGDKITIIEGV